MAAEPAAPSKRPHLLLAQHVMGEVIEGLTETVSSEGLDPSVLEKLEQVCMLRAHGAVPAAHASRLA